MSGPYVIDGLPVVIRVGRSEARLRYELSELLLVLGLGLPAAVGVAAFGGYLLARRALAPVGRMAERARVITAERLGDRLPVVNPELESEEGRGSTFRITLPQTRTPERSWHMRIGQSSRIGAILTVASVTLLWGIPPSLAAERLDTEKIEHLTGAKGQLNEKEGVFKVNAPRTDLNVTVAGVKLTPPMGLTSWAAFQQVGEQTMVMGDLVVLEDQVNPVMNVTLENGLDVTALHNHFFWDSPKVMFMHIGGTGETEQLAAAVGKVFAKIKETGGGNGEVPHAELDPAKTSLDPQNIETIIGEKGELNNGVYKITLGRTTEVNGHEVGNTMGVNTWAAFVGGDDQAVVDGDFVMFEGELQPVLKALRKANINVVAIHNHMMEESPRTVFLHYWGVGSIGDLAKGVKAALDVRKKK